MSEANGAVEVAAPEFEVDEDGYVIDDQGEEVGVKDPKTGAIAFFRDEPATETGPDRERFEVLTEDAANWVLKLIMAEESELLAIEARRAAILANLDGQSVEHANRLRSLHWRFDNDLAAWARRRLAEARGAAKTVKLMFGKLSFRQSKGSAEVVDPSAALAFVREWAPEKIVPKPVGVEAVKAAIEAARDQSGDEPDCAAFFRAAEPHESFSITTGLGK